MTRILPLSCLLVVAATVLSGCGGGDVSTDASRLRLVNATSGFAGLDLVADNDSTLRGVAPYTVSDYADVEPDSYTLDVRQTGSAATLATASTTLGRRDHRTVVAYTSGGTMTMSVLDDDEDEPSSGNAKVRFFHTAASDTGNVDVYLVSTDCADLASSAAAATATDIGGLQTAYSQVASSSTPYHLCVTGVGDKSDLRLDVPSLRLDENRIVTIVLARGAGGYLLNGLVLEQRGAATQALNASARVRVAASRSPSVPTSVEVNGATIAAGLTSPNVGPYVLVNAGPVAVRIDGSDVAPATPLTAGPGVDVTMLLTGPTPTVTLLADDNTASTSTARPVKLRVVNGVNGTTGTATLTVDNAPVGSGAAFATASGYSLVTASAGLARIEARAGATQLYLRDNVTLASGRVYTLFLLGDLGAAPNTGILVADR